MALEAAVQIMLRISSASAAHHHRLPSQTHCLFPAHTPHMKRKSLQMHVGKNRAKEAQKRTLRRQFSIFHYLRIICKSDRPDVHIQLAHPLTLLRRQLFWQ